MTSVVFPVRDTNAEQAPADSEGRDKKSPQSMYRQKKEVKRMELSFRVPEMLQPLTMSRVELLDDWLQGGSGGRNGKVDSQILQVYGQSWIQQVHL